MGAFEDLENSLLEAIEMERGNLPLVEKEEMPAPTFFVEEKERELVSKLIALRKEQHMTQGELANRTGNKQQAISRIEKGENSPSLKTFSILLNALGYELQIVKKV